MTGCSQGLGYELSKAVLAAGQKLVASSRTPSTTAETVAGIERLGGRWVTLDVALPQLDDRVHAALVAYGRVDVLVHNAGISIGGAVEDFRSDFQAHLWYPVPRPRVLPRPTWHKLVLCSKPTSSTPLRLIQLLTPHMRAPKSGTIINISGGSTWRAMPGIILYAASKAAINESLAVELASLGVRVLLLVPGDIRPSFISPANVATGLICLSEAYKGTMAEHISQAVIAMHGKQPIDPRKAAERMVEMVTGTGVAGETGGEEGSVVEDSDWKGLGGDDESERRGFRGGGGDFGADLV